MSDAGSGPGDVARASRPWYLFAPPSRPPAFVAAREVVAARRGPANVNCGRVGERPAGKRSVGPHADPVSHRSSRTAGASGEKPAPERSFSPLDGPSATSGEQPGPIADAQL